MKTTFIFKYESHLNKKDYTKDLKIAEEGGKVF